METPASRSLCTLGFGAMAGLPCSASGRKLAGQRVKRNAGVGQRLNLGRLPGADQRFDLGVDVPDVDVHAGRDAPAVQPEGDELAALAVAAEDHLIPLRRVPRVLHPHVVLVGVEVRDAVVADLLAEHRAGRGRALVERVRLVLDAYPLT